MTILPPICRALAMGLNEEFEKTKTSLRAQNQTDMTKDDLIKQVVAGTGLPKDEVREVIEVTMERIKDSMKQGQEHLFARVRVVCPRKTRAQDRPRHIARNADPDPGTHGRKIPACRRFQ